MSDTTEKMDFREAGLDGHFANMVAKRQEWKAKKDEADAKIKEYNDRIGTQLVTVNQKSVHVDKFTVTLVAGCNTTISKQALLDLGVPADVIEKATKRTEYTTVQVVERKGE